MGILHSYFEPIVFRLELFKVVGIYLEGFGLLTLLDLCDPISDCRVDLLNYR